MDLISDHCHEALGFLKLVEQSVELIQSQLGEHRLFLVPLIQKLHLQQDHAFAAIGAHAVGSCDCELVVKVDQLAVVDLLEKILQLLSLRTALDFVDRANVVVHIFGVLCYTHFPQSLKLVTLRHALKRVCQSYQVLERSGKVPMRLLVLRAQTLQIFLDFISQVGCVEVFRCEVRFDRTCQQLNQKGLSLAHCR